MKTPKLKAFKAWSSVDSGGYANLNLFETREECRVWIDQGEVPVRVVVRSFEDDAAREAEIRRLRRALRLSAAQSECSCIYWNAKECKPCGAAKAAAAKALARKGGVK